MTPLQKFMYFLLKEARQDSFEEWMEEREITQDEYKELYNFFKIHGVDLNK